MLVVQAPIMYFSRGKTSWVAEKNMSYGILPVHRRHDLTHQLFSLEG